MGSWWLEAIGWIGSAVLVWSLLQTQLRRLRVINLVGCVILIGHDAANRTAQLLLDWVTPRHRDLSPGEFILGTDGPLRRRGYRRFLPPPGMVEPYYADLGLTRDGDAYVL